MHIPFIFKKEAGFILNVHFALSLGAGQTLLILLLEFLVMASGSHSGLQNAGGGVMLIKGNPKDLLLKEVLSKLSFSAGERILDFGCGDGTILKRHLVPIAERLNGKVTGIDISASQINSAIKNNSHPSVEYICGDVFSDKKPLNGKKFNTIICIFVLEYATDY